MVEIEQYGNTVVASGLPDYVDPYGLMDLCDNVEREGAGCYRFDGVHDINELIKRLGE